MTVATGPVTAAEGCTAVVRVPAFDDDAECEDCCRADDPVDEDPVSACALPAAHAIPTPTPNATASPPTRPTQQAAEPD
ncbi:hypothetical protein OG976_07515 [Mycobacterium sp. NBC_00419]|uniref:hypothetical protein n=1 Tax=Mycobacterium sp. NBC_00419 TaxID=2975989 RepID=UPI002E22BCBF